MAIYKIAGVDLADEVLLEYFVNILVLMDCEDVPYKFRLDTLHH